MEGTNEFVDIDKVEQHIKIIFRYLKKFSIW